MRSRRIASGAHGVVAARRESRGNRNVRAMRITGIDLDAVDVNGQHHWVFVHVRTDEGVDGLGELNPIGAERCGPGRTERD